MRLLVVSVRVAGRPLGARKRFVDDCGKPYGHPGYRGGIYSLDVNRQGQHYLKLVGDLITTGGRGVPYSKKSSAINQAKQFCDNHKDQFIYLKGIKQYTKIKDLPNGEDLLTLFDFYDAME